jgi:hypothetical protein
MSTSSKNDNPPFSPSFYSNMASLRIKDLHPVYQIIEHEEAIAIANLGAQTYLAAKEGLFELWNTSQSAEEGEKADVWRREGGQAMIESLKSRLAAGEAAQARMLVLQASVDAEVESRIQDVMEKQSLKMELQKVAPLQQRISALEGKEEMIHVLQKQTDLLHENVKYKETIIDTLQKELDNQKTLNTKSSHAIGKVGEATVLTMIQEYILPVFPFSRVEDKTGVGHAADFH